MSMATSMTAEVIDKVDQLYQKYNLLSDAGEKIGEHQDAYVYILDAMKGSTSEKRLGSQFLPKFFKHFPAFYDRSVESLFDLCEDEDIVIRKQAIKDLPAICKHCVDLVPKITDILAQLLLAEDPTELQIVNLSLVALCKLHPKGFLGGLFSQIENGEDLTREKVIKFLALKFKTLPEDLWTKEVEEYLIQECRKAMQDCTKDEFLVFMSMLSGLKISKTVSGQQVLVDIIAEQAELENPFDITDADIVDKLLMCVRHSMPHFSQFVPSNAYIQFFCTQVIPNLGKITENQTKDTELQILQSFAEMCPHVQPTNTSCTLNIYDCVSVIFEKLLECMPLPVSDNGNVLEETTTEESPSIQLTHVESLMFSFHQLCKHNTEFFSSTDDLKLKDFKLRLQFLARGIQNYIKKIRASLADVKASQMKTDENKMKLIALKTTTNINVLIRDLFHSPPAFKATISLSWKPHGKQAITKPLRGIKSLPVIDPKPAPEQVLVLEVETTPATTEQSGTKRKMITAPEGSPTKKDGQKVYEPPSGKFSSNFSYRGQGGRGYGRGFGRGRGFRGGRGYKQRFSY